MNDVLSRAEQVIAGMDENSLHCQRIKSSVNRLRQVLAAAARDPFRESVERRRGARVIDWQVEVTEAARALSLLLDQG